MTGHADAALDSCGATWLLAAISLVLTSAGCAPAEYREARAAMAATSTMEVLAIDGIAGKERAPSSIRRS